MSLGPVASTSGGPSVQPLGSSAGSQGGAAPAAAPVQPVSLPAAQQVAAEIATSLEQVLSAASGQAAATQDSLAPLLANLTAAADSSALPPAARAVAAQILASQTPLTPETTAEDLRSALANSGLFMETSLAVALTEPGADEPDLTGDLKAQLLQLGAQLTPAAETELAALQSAPPPPRPPLRATPRSAARPPPPTAGGVTAGQRVMRPTLDEHDDPETVAAGLKQDVDAALARLQLSQIASVPHPGAPVRWAFELPVESGGGSAIAQFEISRDGQNAATGEAAPPSWRARFSVDVEPGGPVHAEISLKQGRVRITLWAERDGVRQNLTEAQGELVSDLTGDETPDVAVRVIGGAPPAPPPKPGRFLDRTS